MNLLDFLMTYTGDKDIVQLKGNSCKALSEPVRSEFIRNGEEYEKYLLTEVLSIDAVNDVLVIFIDVEETDCE